MRSPLLLSICCLLLSPVVGFWVYQASQETSFAFLSASALLFSSCMLGLEYLMKRQNIPLISSSEVKRRHSDGKRDPVRH
ncbi:MULTISPECIES: hypothetical protein [Corallincola]|uniref:Uncharacterized protein n=2 Tax=Corallincola TaxID=1775176 RepID=A0ABY1WRX1_9GAMM|nr:MULTISPECIES: hypothetical protein [Corallincola]TAA47338.1 hypothetical protein EXY25_08890 [Corallincola spongiicola]TCI04999.1 hypothetical protein EZV61_03275 [Corallincola luteus]